MKQNLKANEIVIKMHYITQEDFTKNTYNITFKAKKIDNKTMKFFGEYFISYKEIEYTTEGFYKIGNDLRNELLPILKEDFHIDIILYEEKSKDKKILIEILKSIAPIYKQF
ncbi:TPA: hypothetical protein PTV74_003321 [Clostridium botulinum]|nr:hypothetical protein [Clostridium botulinum]HDK7206476.1 hypothetical protein [Clostridium botulinum]HDK7210211.1 hypothetical protein [Clostridium botulinum]HDK7265661.1 hypothetical protein [Clostridium botulinum]HDK7269508.1 hypothetical protein [Clostridium botulinum]